MLCALGKRVDGKFEGWNACFVSSGLRVSALVGVPLMADGGSIYCVTIRFRLGLLRESMPPWNKYVETICHVGCLGLLLRAGRLAASRCHQVARVAVNGPWLSIRIYLRDYDGMDYDV